MTPETVLRSVGGTLSPWLERFARQRYLARITLGQACAELGAQRTEIQALAAELESRFGEFATLLTDLSENCRRTLKDSESLLELASGRGDAGNVLDESVRRLNEPLAFLDNVSRGTGRMIDRLEQARQTMGRVLAYESEILTTVAPLQIIQTLFRIESAHLNADVQNAFVALTTEIATLQVRVKEGIHNQFRGLEAARLALAEANAVLSFEQETQARAIAVRRSGLTDAMHRLRAELDSNRDREVGLTRVSRSLSREVDRAIVVLQSQDIVNQKLQHVEEALAELQSAGDQLAASGREDRGHAAGKLFHVASLQARQMQHASAEIRKAGTEAAQAVSVILDRMSQLDENCLLLREFREVTVAVTGMVQVLLDTTAEVAGLVDGAAGSAARCCECIHPVAALTLDLGATLDLLGDQIRILGLNAQIQAVKTGSGTGLEVLAARTADISAEMVAANGRMSGEFRNLREHIDEDREALEAWLRSADHFRGELRGSTADSEQRLHGLRDRVLSLLTEVGNSVEGGKQIGNRMSSVLELDRVADVVASHEQHLTTIQNEAGRLLSAEELHNAAHTEHLQARYTMASERKVHAAHSRASAPASRLAEADDAGAVELF